VEYFFNAGIEPIIVTPPPGHDPDSFVREYGKDAVYRLLDEGVDYLSFRFNKINSTALTMREKEQMAREIRRLGAKIDDTLRRNVFYSKAADRLNLPPSTFEKGMASIQDEQDEKVAPERVRNINVIESEFLSAFIIRPVLLEGAWKDISPDDLHGPGHGKIYSLFIEHYRETGEIRPDRLIEQLDSETEKSAMALIATLEWGELDLGGVVKDYKRMILDQKRKRQIASLQLQLSEAEKEGNRELAQKLTREIKYLLEKRP
jgi:DNA primase